MFVGITVILVDDVKAFTKEKPDLAFVDVSDAVYVAALDVEKADFIMSAVEFRTEALIYDYLLTKTLEFKGPTISKKYQRMQPYNWRQKIPGYRSISPQLTLRC